MSTPTAPVRRHPVYPLDMARYDRADLPPIVASWPARSVWLLATGTVHSGLPGRPGSAVSVTLPPRKKSGSVMAELEVGLEPETLAFGRMTRTTAKFHAQLKTPFTDIAQLYLSPIEGSSQRNVLVVRLRQGGVVAIAFAALAPLRLRLLELQLTEIWTRATENLRNWQELYGPEGLHGLSPLAFERLVAHVFETSGTVTHTGRTGDGGIDIEVMSDGNLVIVQCKRFRSPVGPAPVRELLGALSARGAQQGVLVSTASFTDGAQRFADEHSIVLVDSNQLATLARELQPAQAQPAAAAGTQSASVREPWPLPSRLGSWVSLNVSTSTPRFTPPPPTPITRIVLRGLGTGLAGGLIFLIGLGIWAMSSPTLLPSALFLAVAVIAFAWGLHNASEEDAKRTTECSSCRHDAAFHRLDAFSPHRLRLTCGSCSSCENVLPDPVTSAKGSLRPLLYMEPPTNGTITIERATAANDWFVVTTMAVSHGGPILLTDASGVLGVNRYRFRFDPAQPLPVVAQPVTPTVSETAAIPEQRCPKCRKRLRLSRHWEDGRGYWSCWTCGFSRELTETGSS